jgi:hypothetical protein
VNNRTAKALGGASTLAIVLGIGYLIDCRTDPKANRAECWVAGGGLMGIGGSYKLGYATPNPDITPRQRRQAAQTEKVE